MGPYTRLPSRSPNTVRGENPLAPADTMAAICVLGLPVPHRTLDVSGAGSAAARATQIPRKKRIAPKPRFQLSRAGLTARCPRHGRLDRERAELEQDSAGQGLSERDATRS